MSHTVKAVTCFKAEDGRIFTTADEAVAHNHYLAAREWYDDNKIYGTCYGCRIEFEDLLEWINKNQEDFTYFFGSKRKISHLSKGLAG